MKKIFIDSDIIVDFLTQREPFDQNSSKVLNLCINEKVKGYITPIIVSNIYYVLRKEIDSKELKIKLKSLLGFLDVIKVDKNIILTALNSDFKDFKDALQNFSAIENSEIDTILTRNVKDYKTSTLSVYTPESFLKTLN
jgi:predicted nucleic acid-binding protein